MSGAPARLRYSADGLALLKVAADAIVAGSVAVDDAAGETADRQFMNARYVMECVGSQLVGGKVDVLAAFAGEDAAVEDEQQFVALGLVGCPVRDQETTDRRGDAKLFAGSRAAAWVGVSPWWI